jgi:mannose-1-phosphate guanylyltransferase/mannose-6-phosphate isomerase
VNNLIPIILAGGSGTRLWPLSRPGTPKQFLRVFGDKTLLQDTILRVLPLKPVHVVVVTGESLQMETAAQIKELGLAADFVTVLTEPCARNTAPAIALAAAWVRDRFAAGATMIVLPADHHIAAPQEFLAGLTAAVSAAADGALVTLGIRPSGPETGYGYINAILSDGPVAEVRAFVEKPDLQRAMEYLQAGTYFWNSGIFIWTAASILKAVDRHMSDLARLAKLPWEDFRRRFADAPGISVDYGILEKADNVRMVAAEFVWSDVGTWDSLAEFWREEGKLASPSVQVRSESVDVFSRRKVAVVGVEDIMVIDADEGLLIMKKGQGQDVGAVAKRFAGMPADVLPETGTVPRTVPKPWGRELIWAETPSYVGKTLTIRKGESLSLQYHRLKDETIHVLKGKLIFRHGRDAAALEEKIMLPGESFHIETLTVHQMEALEDCDVLEVSTPHLQDVVRLLDRYGR